VSVEYLTEAHDNPPTLARPLFSCRVRAGFPSAADDFMDRGLDLNEYYIQHPSATYFVKAEGDSLIGMGIHDGDLLIVDQSLTPRHGNLVIAALHGELTCKLLDTQKMQLRAANPKFSPIPIDDLDNLVIEGVVTHSIRHHTNQ
jgi:DNA polymerase V